MFVVGLFLWIYSSPAVMKIFGTKLQKNKTTGEFDCKDAKLFGIPVAPIMNAFPKYTNQLICAAYIVKPLVLFLLLIFNGQYKKMTRSFYARKIFQERIFLDFAFVPMLLYYMMVTYHMAGWIFPVVWAPIIIANILIYFF